jgi:hypothetical protein
LSCGINENHIANLYWSPSLNFLLAGARRYQPRYNMARPTVDAKKKDAEAPGE